MTDLVVRQLAERGITITPRQRESLDKHLRAGGEGVWRSSRWGAWKFWEENRALEVSVTEAEAQAIADEIQGRIDKLPELLGRVVPAAVEKTAPALWAALRPGYLKDIKRDEARFQRLEQEIAHYWRQPFETLSLLIELAYRLPFSIDEYYVQQELTEPHLVDVLTRLNMRAVHTAREVLTLLRTGYPDAAMARWRTLHELAVVASFVSDHGESCAERYLAHEVIESAKGARQYQEFAGRLGFESLSDEEIARINATKAAAIAKYGREFGEDNGWAGPYVHRARPTFADLESAVDLGHLRPFYRMAGHSIHANPKGAQFKIGAVQPGTLLVGPSPHGLADPGQNTALSLAIMVAHLCRICPTADILFGARIALQLARDAATQFVEVDDSIKIVAVASDDAKK